MQNFENGLWAGTLATGPMTIAMMAMQKSLPPREKSPLPPATLSTQIGEKIIGKLDEHIGVDQSLNSNQRSNLAIASHFAYGATTGIVFAQIQDRLPGPAIIKGAAFGLGVWTLSYLGWIPLVGFRAAAPKMPARRNAMMIAAHVLWGAALGFAERELRQSGNQLWDGHRRARAAE